MSIFNIQDLHLFYGQTEALKGINMDIEKNEITAFIGPSGCGKSTLLKTLNRMNDLEENVRITGNVIFDGKNAYTEMDLIALRYRVGMVFQQPNPFLRAYTIISLTALVCKASLALANLMKSWKLV